MKLEDTKIYIHIGYHKTGSTYLQGLFEQANVNFLFLSGKNRELLDYAELQKNFSAKVFINKINRYINKLEFPTTILSHEELSGHPHGDKKIDPYKTALNLKSAFPNAKIIIVVRNQLDYLKSLYTFRVAIKGSEIRNFTKFTIEEGQNGLFEKLQYHKIIEYYAKLFKKDNILVLPMEVLKSEPDSFFQQLEGFMNITFNHQNYKPSVKKTNQSTKNQTIINIFRVINIPLFFYKKMGFTGWLDNRFRYAFFGLKRYLAFILNYIFKSKNVEIPLTIKKKLRDELSISNQKLQKFVVFNLKKLGYA